MKTIKKYLFCSEKLLSNVEEINEIDTCLSLVKWEKEFAIDFKNTKFQYQSAYNKAFQIEFSKYNWTPQPLLHDNPKLIGDFMKNDIFIEIQFGNSATLYRDYYKFHYGVSKKLLSLAVLIVPTSPKLFFPTRISSVNNMAEYDLAVKYYELLPLPIPILVIGLLPEN